LTETLEQVPRIPTGPRSARLCPECKGSKLIRDYDTAEVVCMTCGFVVTDKIADSRPEWRAFDDEQRAKRARTGAPMTFTIHDKGLSTIIDWRDRPSGTKSVSADQRIELIVHRSLSQVAGELAEQGRFALPLRRGFFLRRPRQLFANAREPQPALVQNFRGKTFFFAQQS